MQKSIVISALLFIVLSCKNSNNNRPGDPGTSADTTLNHDTVKQVEHPIKESGSDTSIAKKSFPVSKNITMVGVKMRNKAVLDDVDYGFIGKFLTENKEESQSEAIGEYLFEYFSGNGPANKKYAAYLNRKGSVYKEKILRKFVSIMCIDLGLDNYTYDKLISDFPVCKGSNAAQMALKTCIANHVD